MKRDVAADLGDNLSERSWQRQAALAVAKEPTLGFLWDGLSFVHISRGLEEFEIAVSNRSAYRRIPKDVFATVGALGTLTGNPSKNDSFSNSPIRASQSPLQSLRSVLRPRAASVCGPVCPTQR